MPSQNNEPAKRQPRVQFSLWSLLIVTTVAAILFSAISAKRAFGPVDMFFALVFMVIQVAGPVFVLTVACSYEPINFGRVMKLISSVAGVYFLSAVTVVGRGIFDVDDFAYTVFISSLWWMAQCCLISIGIIAFYVAKSMDARDRRRRKLSYPNQLTVNPMGDTDSRRSPSNIVNANE